MIKEFDRVVLSRNLPHLNLKKGDVGTVVMVHGKEGCEVEFFKLNGETLTVETLTMKDVRPISDSEMLHAREL